MSTNGGASEYDGGGRGGKFGRKPFRRAMPYDRPPNAVRNPRGGGVASGGGGNGWLSKIVDPASRLISASAHKLFGSMFRKRLLPSPHQAAAPPVVFPTQPAAEVERPTKLRDEVQGGAIGDQQRRKHLSPELHHVDNNGGKQCVSDLEQIFNKKFFTKNEIDRLTALLHSRSMEDATVNHEQGSKAKATDSATGDVDLMESNYKPVPDKGDGAVSSPIVDSKVFEDDIATPAELAKAYISSRPSNVSPSMSDFRGQNYGNELPFVRRVAFPSQSPLMAATATKPFSSFAAPETRYSTPRSKGRSAIYSMARTPYSRMQESSTQRKAINYNPSSSQFALKSTKPSSSRQTALKRRSSVLHDDIGSVGPIRRVRPKAAFTSSQGLSGQASDNSPNNACGVMSKYHTNFAENGTRVANFMSVPSQSSEVAQKILQQLDKLAPSPKGKLSKSQPALVPDKSPFTLKPEMLSGQALRSLEKIDSIKILESSRANSLSEASNTKTSNVKWKNVDQNAQEKLTSFSEMKSDVDLISNSCPLIQNKRAFQITADEDCLDLDQDNGCSNSAASDQKEGRVNLVNSSQDTKLQLVNEGTANNSRNSCGEKEHCLFLLNKSDQIASAKPVLPENDSISHMKGTASVTTHPAAVDISSSPLSGRVSSKDKSTATPEFRYGTERVDKYIPFSVTPSDSLVVKTSPSARKTENLSVVMDAPKALELTHCDKNCAPDAGDGEGKSSAILSNGISAASNLFISGSHANNGFANGALSIHSVTTSSMAPLFSFKHINNDGASKGNSSASPMLDTTSVPNATTGITLSGAIEPYSASPVKNFRSTLSNKDSEFINAPPLDAEAKTKAETAVSNITSKPFGGTSLRNTNDGNTFSGFGSSFNSPKADNQGLGSTFSTQAVNTGTVVGSVPQSTPFQFASSRFLSAPSFGLSGTSFASASAMTSAPAANVVGSSPTFGLTSSASINGAGIVGSTSGSTSSLFSSDRQGNSSPVFDSSASSSSASLSAFPFGSSASTVSSSAPGSLFGSTGASAGSTFSFTSASASTSPSMFSASQPVFGGESNPVFGFGSASAATNINSNNNQVSMEDSMAEDASQTSAPSTHVFGQPQSIPSTSFVFNTNLTTSPSTGLFQFATQPSPATPANQSPFQASGSFSAGGSFSLGPSGGDKSNRKFVKVKRTAKKR